MNMHYFLDSFLTLNFKNTLSQGFVHFLCSFTGDAQFIQFHFLAKGWPVLFCLSLGSDRGTPLLGSENEHNIKMVLTLR